MLVAFSRQQSSDAYAGWRNREGCCWLFWENFSPRCSQERSERAVVQRSCGTLIFSRWFEEMRSLWLILTIARILESILGDRVCHPNDTEISIPGQRSQEILSRRRRLTFPMGSTFVVSVGSLDRWASPWERKCVFGGIRNESFSVLRSETIVSFLGGILKRY